MHGTNNITFDEYTGLQMVQSVTYDVLHGFYQGVHNLNTSKRFYSIA
jgi:hypothetical protein